MARSRKPTELPTSFEGLDVLGHGLIIRNTGSGLEKSMEVEPRFIGVGDTVTVVIEAECIDIHHPRIKDTDGVSRVPVLKAGTATFVEAELVADVLEAQRIAIEKHEGVQRLDFDEADDPGDTPPADG